MQLPWGSLASPAQTAGPPVPDQSRNDARMPHCLRWGGMASLLGGLGDRFPQHDRDLPSKAPPLAAGIFITAARPRAPPLAACARRLPRCLLPLGRVERRRGSMTPTASSVLSSDDDSAKLPPPPGFPPAVFPWLLRTMPISRLAASKPGLPSLPDGGLLQACKTAEPLAHWRGARPASTRATGPDPGAEHGWSPRTREWLALGWD